MPKFYEPEQLKHLQKLEMEILTDFKRICDENNLIYFGYAGTGIGALRHKGYIPWDDDIDISMPRKDYERFMELVTEQMGDKYEVLNTETDINYPLATTRLVLKGTKFREYSMKDVDCNWGIFLDLYALDNAADGMVLGKASYPQKHSKAISVCTRAYSQACHCSMCCRALYYEAAWHFKGMAVHEEGEGEQKVRECQNRENSIFL